MNVKGSSKVSFSDRTLGFLIQGWKTGKAALTILLLGAICILAAFSLALANLQLPAFVFLGLGAILIAFIIYQFYYEAIVPARHASKQIEENAEILDIVQSATLDLTNIIIDINDFSLINSNFIVELISTTRHLLDKYPFAKSIFKDEYLDKPEQFALRVRTIAAASRTVVGKFGDAVEKSDLKRIKEQVGALKGLRTKIEAELALTR